MDAGREAFGIDKLDVTKLSICSVDTAKYKKEPTERVLPDRARSPGPDELVGGRERGGVPGAGEGQERQGALRVGQRRRHQAGRQHPAARLPEARRDGRRADGPGIVGQIKAATAQGIPVVACAGQLPDNSGVVSTVTRSYDLQGKLWAEWVAKQIGGKGRIAMISGIAGVPTAEFPKAAAEKVFADKYPDIKIVSKQYDDWSPTKAKTVAASLVSKNLDAIWSDSSFTALGVYEAYTQAGKPVPPVTGDASNAFLKAVQGKDVKFALSPFPPELSSQCFDTALDIVQGKPVPNFVNVAGAGVHVTPGRGRVHQARVLGTTCGCRRPCPRPKQKALKLC